MRIHEMTSHDLIKVIQSTGLTPRSYSGRCMFGKRCVAVVVGSDDDTFDIPRGNLVDDYALKQIYYWPEKIWPADIVEIDEEDDDEDEDYAD